MTKPQVQAQTRNAASGGWIAWLANMATLFGISVSSILDALGISISLKTIIFGLMALIAGVCWGRTTPPPKSLPADTQVTASSTRSNGAAKTTPSVPSNKAKHEPVQLDAIVVSPGTKTRAEYLATRTTKDQICSRRQVARCSANDTCEQEGIASSISEEMACVAELSAR